jgi:hypothetical protein
VNIAVFSALALFSLEEFYCHFRGACCPITLMMQAAGTSEMLVNLNSVHTAKKTQHFAHTEIKC